MLSRAPVRAWHAPIPMRVCSLVCCTLPLCGRETVARRLGLARGVICFCGQRARLRE